MKKILLVSMLCNVTGLLKKAEPDLNGKTVTYIPTAAIAEEIEGMAEAETRMLEELGLTVDELEVSTASKDNVREKLAKNDMIFVGGGNTFFLLQELKRSGADQIIAREVEKGKQKGSSISASLPGRSRPARTSGILRRWMCPGRRRN